MLLSIIKCCVCTALLAIAAQAEDHFFGGKYEVEGRSIPGTEIVIRVDTFEAHGFLDFIVVQSNAERIQGNVFECVATQGGIRSADLRIGTRSLSLIGSRFLVLIIDDKLVFCDTNPFDQKTWTDELYPQQRIDLALKEALLKRGFKLGD